MAPKQLSPPTFVLDSITGNAWRTVKLKQVGAPGLVVVVVPAADAGSLEVGQSYELALRPVDSAKKRREAPPTPRLDVPRGAKPLPPQPPVIVPPAPVAPQPPAAVPPADPPK